MVHTKFSKISSVDYKTSKMYGTMFLVNRKTMLTLQGKGIILEDAYGRFRTVSKNTFS